MWTVNAWASAQEVKQSLANDNTVQPKLHVRVVIKRWHAGASLNSNERVLLEELLGISAAEQFGHLVLGSTKG